MPIEVGTQGNRIQILDDLGNLTPVAITSTGLLTGSDIALSGTGMGSVVHSQHNTIARTDTSAKNLFTLPANAVITSVRVYVPTASDAVTTATISVGKSGAATAYLNAQDVKGAGTGVISSGAKQVLGSIGSSAVTVQGIYAETGGASSTGGPFAVYIDYTTV
jgi:hypothetical protein